MLKTVTIMKAIKYFATAFAIVLLSACQGDWDEPNNVPYGNNSINEENIITIAELKDRYPNVFAETDEYKLIEEDIKIKARVTGNDIGSNIYKQIALQDETGAIIVSINQSGMHGFLAEGQEIIVDLKGLYIGGYRKQPQIGAIYYNENHSAVELGRMYKETFQQHYRYVGTPDPTVIKPEEFNINWDKNKECAKLVTLKNVSFKPVGGLGTFAPDTTVDRSVSITGGCVNRVLNEYTESQLVVRTSTYANFAAMKLPYDEVNKRPIKCNLTGIMNRYNNTWQLLIRKIDDIEIIDEGVKYDDGGLNGE